MMLLREVIRKYSLRGKQKDEQRRVESKKFNTSLLVIHSAKRAVSRSPRGKLWDTTFELTHTVHVVIIS